MRIITLDSNKRIIGYKLVGDNYLNKAGLQPNEMVSDLGRLFQVLQEDGTFADYVPPEPSLEEVKSVKIQELENKCTSIKDGGFTSNCLGENKAFDSSPENRNLIMGLSMKASLLASGVQLADSTLDWKSASDPVCYPWAPSQIIQLGTDLSTFLSSTIKHKERLQEYVRNLTSKEEVLKVTWETEIHE